MKMEILIELLEPCVEFADKAEARLKEELEAVEKTADPYLHACGLAEAYAKALGSYEACMNSVKRYVEHQKEDMKNDGTI